MATVEPAPQPSAVGPAQNNTWDVVVPDDLAQQRIDRILVIPLSGSAASATVIATTDPAVASRKKQIAKWTNVTAAAPVDDTGPYGQGFSWDYEAKTVRVKIVPDAGNDNAYEIRLIMSRRY